MAIALKICQIKQGLGEHVTIQQDTSNGVLCERYFSVFEN